MGPEQFVQFLKRIRVAASSAKSSASFIASGLTNAALGRHEAHRVQLVAGDEAPEFELAASDGRTYRLSDFTGRRAVVVAWFPKAFTGGCTAECKSIDASRGAFDRFDVAYFGASVDSAETNRQFASSMGIGFPILSDPGRAVARAYGVIGRSGFPSRWTFYIGSDRRILAIDKRVHWTTHGPDIETALTKLQIARSDA